MEDFFSHFFFIKATKKTCAKKSIQLTDNCHTVQIFCFMLLMLKWIYMAGIRIKCKFRKYANSVSFLIEFENQIFYLKKKKKGIIDLGYSAMD